MPPLRFFLSLVLPILVLHADPLPAPLFSDGAILQQGRAVPIWGTATPGEHVTVSFADSSVSTTAGPDGSWMVLLGPLAPSSVPDDMRIQGNATHLVRGLLVGEVWLCAGGSGMDWPLSRCLPAPATATPVLPASHPVRLARIPISRSAGGPITWEDRASGQGSAIAFYFADEIRRKVDIPIGLIQLSCPASALEAWMSPAAFGSSPGLAGAAGEHWQRIVQEFPARQASYKKAEAEWQKAAAKAKKVGDQNYNFFLKKNPEPRPPLGPDSPMEPSSLIAGMLTPTLPYAIRGILWYQGEGNVFNAPLYHRLFPAFIQALRQHFGDPELPFYFVQCPAIPIPDDPSGRLLTELRKAQEDALSLPKTAMAVAIDQTAPNAVKGNDRQEIARRLALLAKHLTYGISADPFGPKLQSCTREGKTLRLRFAHSDSGLIAYQRPVQSLELAGTDHVFHPAQGTIKGDTLLVTASNVSAPVSIRYAWSNSPGANLFNGAGLPAAPFTYELSP